MKSQQPRGSELGTVMLMFVRKPHWKARPPEEVLVVVVVVDVDVVVAVLVVVNVEPWDAVTLQLP